MMKIHRGKTQTIALSDSRDGVARPGIIAHDCLLIRRPVGFYHLLLIWTCFSLNVMRYAQLRS